MIGNTGQYFNTPLTAQMSQPAWGADDSVFGLQKLSDQAQTGNIVHYEVYDKEEKAEDPTLEQVGLYCIHADYEGKKPYVIMLAGGGFTSVCTPWESLPVCAAFQEMGYTCFALTYRVGNQFGERPSEDQIMSDVAAGISYITSHANELQVETEGYLIGGFSAGGVITSMWANEYSGWGKYGLPAPGAVCLMYGVDYEYIQEGYHIPTFSRYCLSDPYFTDHEIFNKISIRLQKDGLSSDIQGVNALHGFGLGTGTDAEGWVNDAQKLWVESLR